MGFFYGNDWAPPLPVADGLRIDTRRRLGGDAGRLVDQLSSNARSGPITRGRAYARAGQVMAVQIDTGVLCGKIQGSDTRPYEVTVKADDITVSAACTCPYGCMSHDWCKHAVAVVLVAAHAMADSSMLARRFWTADRQPTFETEHPAAADLAFVSAARARLSAAREQAATSACSGSWLARARLVLAPPEAVASVLDRLEKQTR